MKEATIKQKKRLPSFRFQDTQDCLGNRQPLAADGRKEDLGVGVTQVSGHHLNSQRCHHFLHLLLVSGLRKTKENITDTVAHTHQKSMYLCGTVCIKEAQPTHTHTHTFWSPQRRISSKCCQVRAAQRDASFLSPGATEKTKSEKKTKVDEDLRMYSTPKSSVLYFPLFFFLQKNNQINIKIQEYDF